MAKKREMPNLSNATQEFLIDEIARLRDEQKDLEWLEGVYKEAVKARFHDANGNVTPLTDSNKAEMAGKVFNGNKFSLEVQYVSQSRINTELFKAEQPEMYKKYIKDINFNQFKFAPLANVIEGTATEVKS